MPTLNFNPIPLPITGEVNVSGTVEATQSGAWTVELSDRPTPVRFGPIEEVTSFGNIPSSRSLIPSLQSGKRFVLTHVSALITSSDPSIPLATGECTLLFNGIQSNGSVGSSPFMGIPIEGQGTRLYGSLQMYVPLNGDEGIDVVCTGRTSDSSVVPQVFRATAGGYFLPPAKQ